MRTCRALNSGEEKENDTKSAYKSEKFASGHEILSYGYLGKRFGVAVICRLEH
jgi:hypothetical protein